MWRATGRRQLVSWCQEMAELEKCLAYKYEDLSLSPQLLCERELSMAVCCSVTPGLEVEADGSLDFSDWLDSESMSSRFKERPCFHKEERIKGRKKECTRALIPVYTHMNKFILVDTHV